MLLPVVSFLLPVACFLASVSRCLAPDAWCLVSIACCQFPVPASPYSGYAVASAGSLVPWLWLVPLGVAVGALGTLIGAGGGFLLIPVLILAYPELTPDQITAISMTVVLFNATSGTIAYSRMKRIDYRSGIWFSLACMPGAFLGAFLTHYIPRRGFDLAFGVLLVALAAFLTVRKQAQATHQRAVGRFSVTRTVIEATGDKHVYSYNLLAAMLISVGVGMMSNILGLGGGIIHVPVMVHVLNFPVHLATATSHFVLVGTSIAGTAEHLWGGEFMKVWDMAIPLALGAVVGAQLGAALAKRVRGKWILVCLAVALASAGVRIFIRSI